MLFQQQAILAVGFSRDRGEDYVPFGSHIGRGGGGGVTNKDYMGLHYKQKREKKTKMTYQCQESLDVDALTRYQANLTLVGRCSTLIAQISSYIQVKHT